MIPFERAFAGLGFSNWYAKLFCKILQLDPRLGIDCSTARYNQWSFRSLQPLDDSSDEFRFGKRAAHMPNPVLEKRGRPVKGFSMHVLRKADRDCTSVRGIGQNPRGFRQAGLQLLRPRDAATEVEYWQKGAAGDYVAA